MKRIQRSFSTIGLPERRISTAAIISKIKIIFKKEKQKEKFYKKKTTNIFIFTNQTNNTTNGLPNIIIFSRYYINTSEKKNQN